MVGLVRYFKRRKTHHMNYSYVSQGEGRADRRRQACLRERDSPDVYRQSHDADGETSMIARLTLFNDAFPIVIVHDHSVLPRHL